MCTSESSVKHVVHHDICMYMDNGHRGAGPCTLLAHYAHYAHFSNLAIPLKNKLQGFNPEKGGMESEHFNEQRFGGSLLNSAEKVGFSMSE
jgi:hypothetical protein